MPRHMREVVIVAGLPSRNSSIFIDGEMVERVTRIEVLADGRDPEGASRVLVEFVPDRIAFVGPACVETTEWKAEEQRPDWQRLGTIAAYFHISPFDLVAYPSSVLGALDAVTPEATA